VYGELLLLPPPPFPAFTLLLDGGAIICGDVECLLRLLPELLLLCDIIEFICCCDMPCQLGAQFGRYCPLNGCFSKNFCVLN
jgi:hypothetical protein